MADLAEQLNGLINLLQAVGIDSVDNRDLKKASVALKNNGMGAPIVFPPDVPEAKQLNDDQIQAMILKLQQAKAQAPNLMEAMEDYIGRKNGVTSSRGTKKRTKKKAGGTAPRLAPPPKDGPSHLYQQPVYEDEEYVEQVMEEPPQNDHDDYDEDEEDDDFDEDADYPMVGPGISDDISVVSDMTTPTVVSSIHVHEEEQYNDMLPSMYMSNGGNGPPLRIQPPKRKNLVSQVGGRAAGGGVPMRVGPAQAAAQQQQPVGGAATRRRQTYQQTMSRLHQNPYGINMAGPAVNPNVPVISEEDEDELRSSSHSNQEFASKPDNWQPFSDPSAHQMDESGHSAASGKPKKKGKGTKKGAGGTRSTSPKPKKKKAPAGTTIDKTGFPAEGKGEPASPSSAKPKKSKDQLSKSAHSNASDGKVIKKKKKVVKKTSGEGEGVAAPKPKKKVAPRT